MLGLTLRPFSRLASSCFRSASPVLQIRCQLHLLGPLEVRLQALLNHASYSWSGLESKGTGCLRCHRTNNDTCLTLASGSNSDTVASFLKPLLYASMNAVMPYKVNRCGLWGEEVKVWSCWYGRIQETCLGIASNSNIVASLFRHQAQRLLHAILPCSMPATAGAGSEAKAPTASSCWGMGRQEPCLTTASDSKTKALLLKPHVQALVLPLLARPPLNYVLLCRVIPATAGVG